MTTSPLRITDVSISMPENRHGAAADRDCTVPLWRFGQGRLEACEDNIAVEADLHIHVGNRAEAVLSRTPGDDLNLVTGHLYCNELIEAPEEVANIGFRYQDPERVDVVIDHSRGMRRIFPKRPESFISPGRLFAMKETFERRQNLFRHTGATHAAALFSRDGTLLAFGEDVGRHNSFDKAIGRALREGALSKVSIAMLSSRIAVELAYKAVRAKIPILCGFSAATSSGVAFAEKNGITLVGRLRRETFDVYANPRRLRSE